MQEKFKKIYFLTNGLFRFAGTERVISQIHSELSKDYDIEIIVPGDTKDIFSQEESSKIISLSIGDNFNGFFNKIKSRINYYNILKKQHVENHTLFSFVLDINIINILLTRKGNGHSIVCEHIEYNYHGLLRRILRFFLYRLKNVSVVCLTQKDRDKFAKIGIQSQVIPNFVFKKNSHPTTVKDKIILAVGRLVEQKNFSDLIDIFFSSALQKNGWKLIIVGEGEQKNLLLNKISYLGMEDHIELHSFTKEIENYYLKSSVFCLTSKFEAFPMVLLEAMSFGLPIISYNCPTGPAEILQNDEQQIAKFLDKNEFTQKLIKLCSDNEIYADISKKNLNIIKSYFPEEVVKSWIKLIEG